jgi:hypothetical protein
MLQALRTRRRFALATLTAFILVQPAVACAALCVMDRHSAATHSAAGMDRDSPTLTQTDCHSTGSGSVQRSPLPVISPMEPAQATIIAVAPFGWVEPVRTPPTYLHSISRSVDPPPPRWA